MSDLPVLYIPAKCDDCGVREGFFHADLCDVPLCPHCGEQRLGCACPPRQRRRVRFIEWPQLCAKCGEQDPGHFWVSNTDWSQTIPKEHRGDIICFPCFMAIRHILQLPECAYTLPPTREEILDRLTERNIAWSTKLLAEADKEKAS